MNIHKSKILKGFFVRFSITAFILIVAFSIQLSQGQKVTTDPERTEDGTCSTCTVDYLGLDYDESEDGTCSTCTVDYLGLDYDESEDGTCSTCTVGDLLLENDD